ncbi:HAD family phosphatase [Litorilinea aerophila]|uniref:HAD family hydrolase n=1 Tax=Litorilinea aerophila TaxID=1204385 RepID=UPI001476FC7B|nr:HAD family phosphatase [Litorilinea aerophila]MCC9077523.1 HAD family phosphatase [Litorilinea aerophila]
MSAVLWDLDGTIADTEILHFRAWRDVMARHGVAYDFATFQAGFGRPNSEILPELLGEEATPERVAQISAEKERLFRRLLQEEGVELLPGVQEWLERFQAAGVAQVISSSGPMANIVATVACLDIGDFFRALLTGAVLPRGKPDPALFLLSAAAVGAEPQECLVLEDSIHGIQAARRAGMASVAVGKLTATPELAALLEEEGPPTLAVASLADLTWEQCQQLWAAARLEKGPGRQSVG